jgi:uncharacterized protein YciI/uncharacterized protein YndB with AHSA1/START domain
VTLPPIHREILVDAPPGVAFALFTSKIGDWWPLAELSVFGAGATVGFEDGALVERSPDGQSAEWGQVTSWLPPGEFSMTWHPGRDTLAASQVTVTFRAAGDQTLVVLEHAGWDVFADPAAARAEYSRGWPEVLRLYQAFTAPGGAQADREPAASAPQNPPENTSHAGNISSSETMSLAEAGSGEDGAGQDGDGGGDGGEATWVALLHRAGPAAEPGVSIFAQPKFREHVGFLQRMAGQGYLVAAGPLPDEDGAGMTILRLPGAGRLADATRLATEDDASVASGFFTVTVRPWQVMLTGPALEG